jgi:hypothetical protein
MPSLIGYAPSTQATGNYLAPPEFQSIAERDAWYRAHPVTHDTRGGAPLIQPQNPNDPFYQRSDITPLLAATNRDVSGQSIGTKLGNAASFELDRFGNLIKNVANDPSRLIFGVDPLGTKVGNALTGSNNNALVGQFGGATPEDFRAYEAANGFGSLGAARELSHSADNIAGIFGAAGALHGLGQAYQSFIPNSSVPMQTYQGGVNNFAETTGDAASASGNNLGIFGGGGAGGLAGVGGGNAGALAASGGISGGAGAYGGAGAVGGLANSLGAASGGVTGASAAGGGSSMGIWSDLIPVIGQVAGSVIQGQGGKNAAAASAAGDAAAIAEQRRQFDLSRSDQMPWLQAGGAALGRLQDPNAFQASPGYAFTRAEGTRDIGNSFAARGGALSGNALRGLDAYNTGLASNEYNNWWNQQAGLAGVGQTSAQSLGGLGQNSANNVSNLLGQQGNARASGIIDQTNAISGGLNNISQWYGNWLRNRQNGGG